MKIAIVCNGRSGSTSLLYLINCLLYKKYKTEYLVYFEPFNYHDRDHLSDKIYDISVFKNENILMKTFIDDDNYPPNSFTNTKEYWEWFVSFFDKIVVLERIDKRLQAESLCYHTKLKKKRGKINWHQQKYYDLTDSDNDDINDIVHCLNEYSLKLNDISNKGFPKFMFEDIFVNKNLNEINRLLQYLDLDYNQNCVDEWINSPYKKVRLDKKINGLI